MEIKEYAIVELLEDLIEGKDFVSPDKQSIKKGSKGTVLEKLENDAVLVEFSYKEYKSPVIAVKVNKLRVIN